MLNSDYDQIQGLQKEYAVFRTCIKFRSPSITTDLAIGKCYTIRCVCTWRTAGAVIVYIYLFIHLFLTWSHTHVFQFLDRLMPTSHYHLCYYTLTCWLDGLCMRRRAVSQSSTSFIKTKLQTVMMRRSSVPWLRLGSGLCGSIKMQSMFARHS